MTGYAFRAATPTDAERITAVTMEGFDTYRAFAPEGWTPPSAADEHARLLGLLAEARARGFAAMRLFTPAPQARARRFYEREGWALARPPAFDERMGLEIAEYRRAL